MAEGVKREIECMLGVCVLTTGVDGDEPSRTGLCVYAPGDIEDLTCSDLGALVTGATRELSRIERRPPSLATAASGELINGK